MLCSATVLASSYYYFFSLFLHSPFSLRRRGARVRQRTRAARVGCVRSLVGGGLGFPIPRWCSLAGADSAPAHTENEIFFFSGQIYCHFPRTAAHPLKQAAGARCARSAWLTPCSRIRGDGGGAQTLVIGGQGTDAPLFQSGEDFFRFSKKYFFFFFSTWSNLLPFLFFPRTIPRGACQEVRVGQPGDVLAVVGFCREHGYVNSTPVLWALSQPAHVQIYGGI